MLALGTATFAWFTTSTTAIASGINVKTIKASELQISKATGDWGTTVDYGVQNKVLLPASTVDGTNWFKANAAVKSAFDATASTIAAVGSTEAGTYYFVDQLNVRNNGSADVNSVEITFSVPGNYTRVALVETSAKGTGYANTGTFTASVYDNAGVAYNGIKQLPTGTDPVSLQAADVTAITPSSTGTVSVGTLHGKDYLNAHKANESDPDATTGEAKYYNLYVWFEGQDVQCFDTNAGVVVDDIEFSVSGTTATQN